MLMIGLESEITPPNHLKVRQRERGRGGDKDSLPFYYLSPSCVVSSGFDKKFLKRDGRYSNEGKFNGPFTPDIKKSCPLRVEDERGRKNRNISSEISFLRIFF